MTALSDSIAFVTGAGGGIGRAIALALGKAGARVGINVNANRAGGEETLRLLRVLGSDGVVLVGDVTLPGMAEGLVEQVGRSLGPVSVLVNNAGIGAPSSIDNALDIDLGDWDRVMDVNLRGALLMSRACLPAMLTAGSGTIVNIASIRGMTSARNLMAYSTSKGGMIALTQSMAVDYARQGVRVNAVSPGFVESEMLTAYIAAQPDPKAARARFFGSASLGRIGRPDEVAEAVVFLASEEASFVTGANLVVDGGNMANGMRELL